MGLAMPSPTLIDNTFYLRVRVPSDLLTAAKGQAVTLPIGESVKIVSIRDGFLKVSLSTREPRVAKERFSAAYAAVQVFWRALKIAGEGDVLPCDR